MERDLQLEALSDMIRRGKPVSLGDALRAIEYQKRLHAARRDEWRNSRIGRFWVWVGRLLGMPT